MNEIVIEIKSGDTDDKNVERIKKLYEQLSALSNCVIRIVVKS